MSIFKTPKGTELPIMDIRGKPYLQVPHRIVWFREEKPEWRIRTWIIQHTEIMAVMAAEISNEKGEIIASAHKVEHKAHFPDFLEKAETGSIGRALALIGYGTQFAPEFHEEDRLADAPTTAAKPAASIPLPIKPMPKAKVPLPNHAPNENSEIGLNQSLELLKKVTAPGIWSRDQVITYVKSVLKKDVPNLTWKEAKDFLALASKRTLEELLNNQ